MGIRANTGSVDIDVNDNGDKISFFISDNEFLKKLSAFFEWFFSSKEEIEKLKMKEESKSNKFKEFNLLISAQEGLSKQAIEKLDEFFGEGTSKKIFGYTSPTFLCVADVIFQLAEEIERIAKEHNKIFGNRYSRRRKGAKS